MNDRQRCLRDVARAAVSALSVGELTDFDDLMDAYASDPRAARRAGRVRAEPTGSAGGLAIQALTLVVTGVAVDIAADLTRDASRKGWSKLRRRIRRTSPGIDEAVPPLPTQQVEQARSAGVAAARRMGTDDVEAERITDAVLTAWAPPD